MSVNKFLGLGRLTKDVLLNSTNGGTSVANFSMALNERYKDKTSGEMVEKTEFINVVAWGSLGETCNKYLHKGSECFIEGRIQTRSYDDKEGVKKYATEIVATNIQFIGNKDSKPKDNSDFGSDDIPF